MGRTVSGVMRMILICRLLMRIVMRRGIFRFTWHQSARVVRRRRLFFLLCYGGNELKKNVGIELGGNDVNVRGFGWVREQMAAAGMLPYPFSCVSVGGFLIVLGVAHG